MYPALVGPNSLHENRIANVTMTSDMRDEGEVREDRLLGNTLSPSILVGWSLFVRNEM